MRPRALLPLLTLLGGCYPWIGGSWEDYWLADRIRLVGSASHTEPLGGYWSDPAPSGEVWWGWLPRHEPGLTALDMLAPAGAGCAPGRGDAAVVTSLLGDPGASVSTLRGPVNLELPFDPGTQRFVLSAPSLPAGDYELDPILSDHAGTLEAQPLLRMPGALAFTGPALNGAEPARVGLGDLVFSWDPAAEGVDWVFIEVGLAKSSGGSGLAAYEWATCLAPVDEGGVSFGTTLWNEPAQATGAYIWQASVSEVLVPVGAQELSASSVGSRRQVGIVFID